MSVIHRFRVVHLFMGNYNFKYCDLARTLLSFAHYASDSSTNSDSTDIDSTNSDSTNSDSTNSDSM